MSRVRTIWPVLALLALLAACGSTPCQFSPVMGPLIFGQGGPLLEVTIARLLTRIRQTIGIRQGHGVDSVGTSFPGS